MSSIRHGSDLTLLHQEGPAFQTTPGGGFDTGTRRFSCLKLNVERYLQRIFTRGMTDSAVMSAVRAAGGTQLAGHRLMLVVNAADEHQSGDKAIITVQYEGARFGAKSELKFTTATEEQSVVPSFGGRTFVTGVRVTVPVPTVLHRYLSLDGRPSITAQAAKKDPPGITPEETKRIAAHYDLWLPTGVEVFAGWVLQSRESMAPGGVEKSPVWMTDDRYQYIVRRSEESFA